VRYVAIALFTLVVGCAEEPYVVAQPDLGDGPAHALLFEFTNSGEQSVEIEVRIDGVVVIEGTVPDRGDEHCRSLTGPLRVDVAEGLHSFDVQPTYATVPWELDVTEDSQILVSLGYESDDGEPSAFIGPGPAPIACR
jgi:hypothetical protein